MKKSLGTALKLLSIKSFKASVTMMMLTLTLYAHCPEVNPVWVKVCSTFNYYSVKNRWRPKANHWFVGFPQKLMSLVDNKIMTLADND